MLPTSPSLFSAACVKVALEKHGALLRDLSPHGEKGGNAPEQVATNRIIRNVLVHSWQLPVKYAYAFDMLISSTYVLCTPVHRYSSTRPSLEALGELL